MKVNRNYTISIENVQKLEAIGNASQLIDDLLTEHFGSEAKPKIINPKQAILDKYDLPMQIKEWVLKLSSKPNALTIKYAMDAHKAKFNTDTRELVGKLWEDLNKIEELKS